MAEPAAAAAAEPAAVAAAASPPADADDLGGTVRFPLEGGPPRVTTPAADVAPGVSKQLIARATRAGEPPTRDDKCFGATRAAWRGDEGS